MATLGKPAQGSSITTSNSQIIKTLVDLIKPSSTIGYSLITVATDGTVSTTKIEGNWYISDV